MSIQAMVWAINTRVGDPGLKVLLISIANYANDEWKCWPSVKTLAHDSEYSERTIQRTLLKLSDLGFIRIEPRHDATGRRSSSMIYLLKGEGVNLSPPDLTPPPRQNDGGRVTQLCRGDGDTTLSPSNEPSQNRHVVEPSIEPPSREMRLVTAADWPVNYADEFWSKYPNKKSKAHAMKVLDKIAKAGKTHFADLINGVERYKLSRDVQRGFVKHPATWLNGECWKDQEQTTPHPVERAKSFMEVAAEAYGNANGARTDQDGGW